MLQYQNLESAKLLALRAKMCQCVLCAHMLTCQLALLVYVLTCPFALRAYMLTCSRVNVP